MKPESNGPMWGRIKRAGYLMLRKASTATTTTAWYGLAHTLWSMACFGKVGAARAVTVYPDDTYLTSYPRSGNIWARFLIGNLLYGPDPVTSVNLETRVPDIYQSS